MLKFKMIKFSEIEVIRVPQGYHNRWGEWIEPTPTTVIRNIKVQPLKPSQLAIVPESFRSRKLLQIFCNNGDLRELKQGVGGWDADRFNWQGDQYEIIRGSNYFDSILDHYEAIAARVELTPNNREITI